MAFKRARKTHWYYYHNPEIEGEIDSRTGKQRVGFRGCFRWVDNGGDPDYIDDGLIIAQRMHVDGEPRKHRPYRLLNYATQEVLGKYDTLEGAQAAYILVESLNL